MYKLVTFLVMFTWMLANIFLTHDGEDDSICDYDRKFHKECRPKEKLEYWIGNFWYYAYMWIA